MPIEVREPRSLPHGADRRFLDAVRVGYDAPIAIPIFTIGAQVGAVREVRIDIVDRLNAPFKERLWMYVVFTDDEGGAPGGTQGVTVTTGTLIEEIAAGHKLLVESDENGVIELEVEEVMAATIYVRGGVWCLPYESGPIDFEAAGSGPGTGEGMGLLLALTQA